MYKGEEKWTEALVRKNIKPLSERYDAPYAAMMKGETLYSLENLCYEFKSSVKSHERRRRRGGRGRGGE